MPTPITPSAALPTNVDRQALFYLFVTALEGGIGYWSAASAYRWALPTGEPDLDGFYAVVEETEEDAPVAHRIDADTILRGLVHFSQPGEGYPHVRAVARAVLAGDDEVDYDAEVADCIVQAGLLGEVVYG